MAKRRASDQKEEIKSWSTTNPLVLFFNDDEPLAKRMAIVHIPESSSSSSTFHIASSSDALSSHTQCTSGDKVQLAAYRASHLVRYEYVPSFLLVGNAKEVFYFVEFLGGGSAGNVYRYRSQYQNKQVALKISQDRREAETLREWVACKRCPSAMVPIFPVDMPSSSSSAIQRYFPIRTKTENNALERRKTDETMEQAQTRLERSMSSSSHFASMSVMSMFPNNMQQLVRHKASWVQRNAIAIARWIVESILCFTVAFQYLRMPRTECRSFLYSDLKLENILVRRRSDDDDHIEVRFGDIGSLCPTDDNPGLGDSSTPTDDLCFMTYFAPERITERNKKSPPIGEQDVVWSLGVVLVQLWTGRVVEDDSPFFTQRFGDNVKRVVDERNKWVRSLSSSSLSSLIESCLSIKRSDRPALASVAAFLADMSKQ
jgi:serine/threonine protein kinase